MKKLLAICCALIFALVAGVGPAAAAPAEDFTLELTFKAKSLCSFEVDLLVTGKSKTIDLPGDGSILPAPGQRVTITNAETGESVTFVITGTSHVSEVDGVTEVKVTGLNVVLNPRGQKSENP